MVWSALCKVLQRQTYDIISHRNGILVLIGGLFLVIISALQFGEVALEWSKDKYEAVFNSFSDNVAGKSFQNRLCLPVPIDVVYTWVNGSDPLLISQVRSYKQRLEQELNETQPGAVTHDSNNCPFANCVPVFMVIVEPALPPSVNVTTLSGRYPGYKNASRMYMLNSPDDVNVTAIVFSTQEQVDIALKENLVNNGYNCTVRQGYVTTDWTAAHSILMSDTVIFSDMKHSHTTEEFKGQLPAHYADKISHIEFHKEKNIAVMTLPKKQDFDDILKDKNITIDGKYPTINAANLVWILHEFGVSEEVSANRFQDNEELRYSLRSIEQHAPWVRHVYIVTNGQIPSWLNLDNPRLTLVTHQEIFVNKSHLPTFSSPSIESHIHRIPGLSDKFIYMNDDVMFGKEVWPDDFYTHAHGQKIYLTWPVPSCHEGCPSTWIKDGYCDKACNNSECEWDGGDCKDGAGRQYGFGGSYVPAGGYNSAALYCSNGCANNWIADRYCDQSCNVKQCGFDAGDCGTAQFHTLHSQLMAQNVTHYELPRGVTIAYFNMSVIFGSEGTISEAHFHSSDVIRTATVAQKHKTLHLLLFSEKNKTELMFEIKGNHIRGGQSFHFNFSITVDTAVVNATHKEVVSPAFNKTKNISESVKPSFAPFVFQDVPLDKRAPKAKIYVRSDKQVPAAVNHTVYDVPDKIKSELDEIDKQLRDGFLTEKGHRLIKARVWNTYMLDLKNKGETLKVKRSPTQKQTQDITAPMTTSKYEIHRTNPPSLSIPVMHKSETKHDQAKNLTLTKDMMEGVNIRVKDNVINQEKLDSDLKAKSKLMEYLKKVPINSKHGGRLKESEIGKIRQNYHHTHGDKENDKRDRDGATPTYQMDSFKARQLNGFLPWEKTGVFVELAKKKRKRDIIKSYETNGGGRRLLDTFGDSLRHVNRIFNKEFGYASRKVPAHMPHMIDKHIMTALQERFPEEWAETSSHQIRSSNDMQYAFSYNYFVMSEVKNVTVEDIFSEMDVDHSGVLSDRELRTFATRLYDLPLDLQKLVNMEKTIVNCSQSATDLNISQIVPESKREKYYDKEMVQVTLSVFINCSPLVTLMHEKFKNRPKYKFEVANDEEVAFKMIKTNVSHVVGQLDDIRRNPRKFICLNDNIDHSKKEAQTVRAVLQDYYESVFPIPSSFELSQDFRNRFLHVDELNKWKQYRDWLRMWINLAIVSLIVYSICSYFGAKIEATWRRLLTCRIFSGRRRLHSHRNTQHV